MRTEDQSYFARRAAEEKAVAERSTCPQAAEAHRAMAECYAALLKGAAVDPKTLSA